jgi:hypothetical protein
MNRISFVKAHPVGDANFSFVGAHPVGDFAWTTKACIAHEVGSYKKCTSL